MPHLEALEEVYRKFGGLFFEQQITMISGRRGSQKSGFGMWLVSQWNLPTLYVNADMTSWTANSRHISIFSGLGKDVVEEALQDHRRAELVAATDRSNIRFMHASRPSLDDLEAEVDAYTEMYDEPYKVVVIDNLMDIDPVAADEHVNLTEILQQLKPIREAGSTIIALHHNKDGGDTNYPSDISGLRGLVSQIPEVIVSVAIENQDGDEMPFRLTVTKQRSGYSDPKAQDWVEIVAEPDRTLFKARSFEQTVVAAPPVAVPVYGNTWGS